MRPRIAAAASLLAATTAVALPSVANAQPFHHHHHPIHNRGLTIGATPNPVVAGEGVLIYGSMHGTDSGDQTVRLYHHLAGIPGYSLVSTTTTNSQGFYEFTRAEGVVTTNRDWYVRGPDGIHSRTVYERVLASVTLSSSAATVNTKQPVTFSGTATPSAPNQAIAIQKQNASGGWVTIATTRTNGQGAYSVARPFGVPNVYTIRAVIRGDLRDETGISNAVTLSVQQAEVAGFTIQSSSPIISEGGNTTISGVLDEAGSNTVEPNTSVTLYGHTLGGAEAAIATTTTGSDGSYSFANVAPTQNTEYRVALTAGGRTSAPLFEGVADVVSMTATPTSVAEGAPVTFSGTVTPNNAGEAVYLQRMNAAGNWVVVGESTINGDGSYSFTRVFGNDGTFQFRTRVYGDGYNVGSASTPQSVTVTGVAPAASLPAAS